MLNDATKYHNLQMSECCLTFLWHILDYNLVHFLFLA